MDYVTTSGTTDDQAYSITDDTESNTLSNRPTPEGVHDDYINYLYKVRDDLNLYFPVVLIVTGCIGNSISYLVYSRTTFTKSVTGFYFRCLAIGDTSTILLGMIPQILEHFFGIYYATSDFTCGLWNFLRLLAYEYSFYLLILVTLERFIGVWYPHRAKVMYTKKNAVISAIAAGFLAFFRNLYYLFSLRLLEYAPGDYICYYKDNFVTFYNKVEPFITLAISSIIPFAIMLILNVAIAICVFNASRRRAAMSGAGNSNNTQGTTGLTVVLLTVTFTFLILSLPDLIRGIQMNFFSMVPGTGSYATGLKAAQLALWYDIASYSAPVNNAVNFFLYCLSGPAFRRELRLMLRCSC